MSDHQTALQPMLILGGGSGGKAFIEAFASGHGMFQIIGVADRDPDAEGMKLATELGIPVFHDIRDALAVCGDCTAINLTSNKAVSLIAAEALGPDSVIGGKEAQMIWGMVSQLRQAHAEIELSQTINESIINSAMEGIILLDSNGHIRAFNAAAEGIFGYTHDEVAGKSMNVLVPHSSNEDVIVKVHVPEGRVVLGVRREVDALRKSGEVFPITLTSSQMICAGKLFFVCITSDISTLKKHEEEIKKIAYMDSLTGLPNRVLFFDRIEHALALSKRKNQKVAVLFLDLDGFKAVNDTMGHEGGDILLKMVAVKLKSSIREMDTVARLGGDEFAFIIDDIESKSNVAIIAEKIIASLDEPFQINNGECKVGCSIGISIFPDNHVEVDDLIRQADIAMYRVKKNGKNNYQFFDETMEFVRPDRIPCTPHHIDIG